jgi:hypothetical protein
MKKILYTISIMLLFFMISCKDDTVVQTTSTSSNKTYLFAKTFGTNVSDLVTGARQSIDGGVVICGLRSSQFGIMIFLSLSHT